MQKKIICSILVFVMIFSVFAVSREKAFADPFTASQIASASYAMFNSWGISFTAGNASAQGMSNFMTQQVENYVNSRGGSIADVFVGNLAVDAAGKLAATYDMYNSVVDFYTWMKQHYDISDELKEMTAGSYNGSSMGDYNVPKEEGGEIPGTGIGMSYDGWTKKTYSGHSTEGFTSGKLYNGGVVISTNPGIDAERLYTGNYSLGYDNQIVYAMIGVIRWTLASPYEYFVRKNVATSVTALDNSLGWNMGSSYTEPTVLYPDKEWTGTVGGYSAPDTNLDQLLGDIDQAVADNNLVVEGEVIDIPVPPPTPMPIEPDTPLQDVPWEGLDNNLQQLYEQGLEEIGTIGEAQDAITEAIGDQTGALEDAIADNAGVVSGAIDQAVSDVEGAIADNAGVVSGAIDQAVSDVQTAIGEQTAALDESLSATAEGVETIAEAIEDEEINWRKFDLRGLFPFCIPFDIYNMLNALDASPTAPHVQLPFVIQSIGFSYMLDLDFSAFDSVAAIMRQMELICYGLALAWATSKVIKW